MTATKCANTWPCVNASDHGPIPHGCVHVSASGSWVDAEDCGGDQ